GYVNTTGGTPLIGVIVEAMKGNFSAVAMTNETGYYAIYDLDEGSYQLNFSKAWVMPYQEAIAVVAGDTLLFNATLTPTNNCGLRGTVTLPDDLPAVGATVTASLVGGGMDTTTTDDAGLYEFMDLVAGTYDMMATLTGYGDGLYTDIQLIPMMWNEQDMELGELAFTASVDPPEGEPGFAIGDDITITFSRPLDPTSVGTETLMLRNMQNGTIVSVEYFFSEDNTIVTMSPVNLLANGVDFRVEVTSLIADVNSNFFSGPFYSNFTTESGVSTIPVSERFPTAGGSEIPVDTEVRVIFPEAMNGSTIDEDTFYLMRGSVRVLATVEYSAFDFTATLVPTYSLEYSTTYTVMVEETIEPLDQYKDFIGDSWVFNTAPVVTTGSIQGFVKDENGNPFTPYLVTITLTKVGAAEGVNIPLQATGEFRYEDQITEGDYELLIAVDGYDDVLKAFSIVPGQVVNFETIPMEAESGSDGDDEKVPIWVIFLIIIVVVIFLFWVIYLMMNKKEEPEEEDSRGMRFGGGRGRQYEDFGGEPMEGEFLCPTCGYVVEADEPDCPNCGSEFEEDLFECPECGAQLGGDAVECPECGSAFEEEVSDDEYGEEEEEDEEEYDPTEEYEVDDDEDYEAPLGMVE
ncbi:MAG: carboxypeptidase regulatory-like domain-containing protein, partial [Thermoplasmata archaeon]|nr:carboxypeptidase regulatory-like domain-containing protein [Thermoplasmata archaeon]